MFDDDDRVTSIEIVQALISVFCLSTAFVAVAMSMKQWSAFTVDASYNEILALREDTWLGISRQANKHVLYLGFAFFVPVVVFAALLRTTFHYVACVICGLAIAAAVIAWMIMPRI